MVAPPPPTPPPAPSTGTYTVVAGDGWYAVARKVGTTVAILLSLNAPMTTNTVLHAGMVLKTPVAAPVPSPPDTSSWPTPEGTPSMSVGSATRPRSTDANTIIPGIANEGRVSWLQAIHGRWPTAGVYDDIDAARVREHQVKGGIYADGIYGEQTEQLYRAWRRR